MLTLSIHLLNETYFLSPRTYDHLRALEDAALSVGILVAELLGWREHYTEGPPYAQISFGMLANGAILSILAGVAGHVWQKRFRIFVVQNDGDVPSPSQRRRHWGLSPVALSLLAFCLGFAVTLFGLGAPLLVQEGILSAWLNLAWPILSGLGQMIAAMLGWRLNELFVARPFSVMLALGAVNGLAGALLGAVFVWLGRLALKVPSDGKCL